jgi:hypothetical protein
MSDKKEQEKQKEQHAAPREVREQTPNSPPKNDPSQVPDENVGNVQKGHRDREQI